MDLLRSIDAAQTTASSLMLLLARKGAIVRVFRTHHWGQDIDDAALPTQTLQNYVNDINDHIHNMKSTLAMIKSFLKLTQER